MKKFFYYSFFLSFCVISTPLFAQTQVEQAIRTGQQRSQEAFNASGEARKSSKDFNRNLREVKNQKAAEKVFRTLSKSVGQLSSEKGEELRRKADEAGLNHRAAMKTTIHAGDRAINKHLEAEGKHQDAAHVRRDVGASLKSEAPQQSAFSESAAIYHQDKADSHSKKAEKINKKLIKLEKEYQKGRPDLPAPPSYKSLEKTDSPPPDQH